VGSQRCPVPANRFSGTESPPEGTLCEAVGHGEVLKAGSHAMEPCEPRQVREEAAVSGHFHVPWGGLAGAEPGQRRSENEPRRWVRGRTRDRIAAAGVAGRRRPRESRANGPAIPAGEAHT